MQQSSSDPAHVVALDRTKIELMRRPNTVFYTTILFSQRIIWEPDARKIPTAAIDGTHLWINPDFFMSLTPAERQGLLIHEILHVALNHMARCGKRHPLVWNYAGDYIINNTLIQYGYTVPKNGLVDDAFKDDNTEQAYAKIFKECNLATLTIPGTGSDIIFPTTAADQGKVSRRVADILVHAAVQAQAAGDDLGTIPGNIMLEIDELLNPKLPWNVIFQNYMSKFCKEDYNMARPNKRFMPDYYMPVSHSERVDDMVIGVDSSGSTTHNKQFHYFVNEIASIQQMLNPEKITAIDWDTKIRSFQDITPDTDILSQIKFKGGGGTDITELINWLIEHKPAICVIFTDGQFNMPKQIPQDTSVIWLVHDDDKWTAPYGEVIHYEMEID